MNELIIFLQFSNEIPQKYYEDVLKDYFRLTNGLTKDSIKDIRLKLIFLTENEKLT
jgi:hypothetical protein